MFELLGHITDYLDGLLGTPWLWVVVFLVSGLDALLPFMPSETTVIIVAVLVAASPARLALLVVLASVGALAGDRLGYAVGRRAGPGLLAGMQRGEKGRRMHTWASAQLRTRGDLLIIAGRYIPGGRMASMLTAGALGYPRRRFLLVDAIGTTIWAVYATAIGYLGGVAFTDRPVEGLLLAFGIGIALAVAIELVRRRADRRVPVE